MALGSRVGLPLDYNGVVTIFFVLSEVRILGDRYLYGPIVLGSAMLKVVPGFVSDASLEAVMSYHSVAGIEYLLLAWPCGYGPGHEVVWVVGGLLCLFVITLVFITLPSYNNSRPSGPSNNNARGPGSAVPNNNRGPNNNNNSNNDARPRSVVASRRGSDTVEYSVPFRFSCCNSCCGGNNRGFLITLAASNLTFTRSNTAIMKSNCLVAFSLGTTIRGGVCPAGKGCIVRISSRRPKATLTNCEGGKCRS